MTVKTLSAILVALLALAPSGSAGAATSCVASPRTGTVPEHVREARIRFTEQAPAAAGGWEERADRAFRLRRDIALGRRDRGAAQGAATAVTGNLEVPVLLNLYSDSGSPPFAAATLQLALFGASANPTMRDYYEEVSYGNLNVEGDVFPWKTLPGTEFGYVGLNNGLSGSSVLFVIASIAAHDATVDFGNYDNDGPDNIPNSGDDDGVVDILVTVFPTSGAECGGSASLGMWSHQNHLSAAGFGPVPTNDPAHNGGQILVDRYFVAPALGCGGGTTGIGVYCHELGHALGIPDLYDFRTGPLFSGDSEGIGWWGLMASGNWNTPSRPGHMCAFTKERLGWLDYLDVNQDLLDLCLPPIESSPTALRVWSQGQYGSEYFVVENRQWEGFDINLPAEGLVIYHVNEDIYDAQKAMNQVNSFEEAKAVDVECADAYTAEHIADADHLDDNTNRGDAGDRWCLGSSTTFGPSTVPDTRALSGAATGVSITNIGNCSGGGPGSGWVCADYLVGLPSAVDLCLPDCDTGDCNEIATCEEWWATPALYVRNFELGGGHDIPAPGIDNKLHIDYRNLGPNDASSVSITAYGAKGAMGLTWPDDAEFVVGTANTSLLPAGESVTETIVFPYPDELDLISHYCIGVVLEHGQDPTLTNSASTSNNIAQINSQVLVDRALGGIARGGSGGGTCPGSYQKDTRIYLYDGVNPEDRPIHVKIRVGTPPDFDDAVIPDNWTITFQPGDAYTLFPGTKDSVTVRASASGVIDGDFADVPLTLWDLIAGEAIGGIHLRFEVDCHDPLAPENGAAEWLPVEGDRLGGPNVRVEWDPVLLDTGGAPERVMRYDVYRQGNGFEVLVGKVAIDAEPSPGFQWYDTIPPDDCQTVYTYRVRAVDLTGGKGAYSAPFDLVCAAATGAPQALGTGGGVHAFPNPFTANTTVRFRTPRTGPVELAVYDARGVRVRLLENGTRNAGAHEVTWDGRDDAGRPVASGVYFARVIGPGVTETRKLVLAR